jgi:hypothetical protein
MQIKINFLFYINSEKMSQKVEVSWAKKSTSFDYSTFILNNQIHSKSFELAFYGHLVPFCQGEASLTLSQFRRILQIILNYMQNLLNDFEQTIRSETTVGGVGDCRIKSQF